MKVDEMRQRDRETERQRDRETMKKNLSYKKFP